MPLARKLGAELIGIFWLVFGGGGSALSVGLVVGGRFFAEVSAPRTTPRRYSRSSLKEPVMS